MPQTLRLARVSCSPRPRLWPAAPQPPRPASPSPAATRPAPPPSRQSLRPAASVPPASVAVAPPPPPLVPALGPVAAPSRPSLRPDGVAVAPSSASERRGPLPRVSRCPATPRPPPHAALPAPCLPRLASALFEAMRRRHVGPRAGQTDAPRPPPPLALAHASPLAPPHDRFALHRAEHTVLGSERTPVVPAVALGVVRHAPALLPQEISRAVTLSLAPLPALAPTSQLVPRRRVVVRASALPPAYCRQFPSVLSTAAPRPERGVSPAQPPLSPSPPPAPPHGPQPPWRLRRRVDGGCR
mmetsp:Transcript_13962/g.33023  ORF Transcript_13962/g.33023 Transcript_13962/m.33023 type:complete len:299 (+) Transcript_13962:698-1594(+)